MAYLDIGQLADRALIHYRWDQHHGVKAPANQHVRWDQQALAVLVTLIAMEIEPLLLAALNVTYRMYEDEGGHCKAEAVFRYADLFWRLHSTEPQQLGWEISGWRSNGERVLRCWCHTRRLFLQADTLAMLGVWREHLRQQAGEPFLSADQGGSPDGV